MQNQRKGRRNKPRNEPVNAHLRNTHIDQRYLYNFRYIVSTKRPMTFLQVISRGGGG